MSDPAAEQVRYGYVRLTNGLPEFIYQDRFDGIPYRLLPGESRDIPVDAAVHLLGWSEPPDQRRMFLHISRRLGWNTKEFLELNPKTGKTKAETWFALLKIEPVIYRLVRDETGGEEVPIPADAGFDEPSPPRRGVRGAAAAP
jgi:hypothetical protein